MGVNRDMKGSMGVRRFLPFLNWFPMTRGQIRADVVAGVTVALVLIPQSMAYAQLAGMPAYYGLYASFLPVMVAAMWGSSAQLATGPVAIVGLMTSAALMPLAQSPEHYVALAALLALMVGILQFSLGVFRLGAAVNLLSHPVLVGFTNAAAIIIALSQLNKLLGVPTERSDSFLKDIAGVLAQLPDTHWPTLAMGVGALGLMIWMRRKLPKWPNVLVAVAVTTAISWAIGFEQRREVAAEAFVDEPVRAMVAAYHETAKEIGKRKEIAAQKNAQAREQEATLAAAEHLRLTQEAQRLMIEAEILAQENRARLAELRALRFAPHAEGMGWIQNTGGEWRIERVRRNGMVVLTAGGEVVGTIPRGLPELKVPHFSWSDMVSLLSSAAVIALLAFMEAISIAKAMAIKTRAKIDPNQELIGQGLANVVAAFSQAFPVSGSFSRSAVNLSAGAVTGFSSVVTAGLVVVTLLFLTPLLYHLPQSVLAAVIMMAVLGLVNVRALVHAWQTHRHDGIAAVATFVATLAFAPHLDLGILLGVALSLGFFLQRRMRPRAVVLGRHAEENRWAGLDVAGVTAASEAVVPVRFDGALIFLNITHFEEAIFEALQRFPKSRAIILVADGINEIDASGEEKLREIANRLAEQGVELHLAEVKRQVLEVLERAHFSEVVPKARFHADLGRAWEALVGGAGSPAQGRDSSPPKEDVPPATEGVR
ncbi:MAG: SulP family inorganic anion transporter [Hydrogenophilus sp.]|nr:SulP family inorganic anion transporter [Hydrogenophilus sp.]